MVLKNIRQALDWLSLADYDRAKDEATRSIVRRYTRGNIFLKNGLYLDRAGSDRLSAVADEAEVRLKKFAHIL